MSCNVQKDTDQKVTRSTNHCGCETRTAETVDELSPIETHKVTKHIHKLERKHSSGDLHSRLKTRKLLGVGETDDGDVHRSKLSQILGHSEQLFIRLPRGLRIWQFLNALMFSVVALWALVFPAQLLEMTFNTPNLTDANLPIRLYGAALLSLSVVFWSTSQSMDKDIIRWSLISSCVYFFIQTLVTIGSLWERNNFTPNAVLLQLVRLVFAFISYYYYHCLTHKSSTCLTMRRSTSDKDLRAAEPKTNGLQTEEGKKNM